MESEVFSKERNDEAIGRVCACFDEQGLTLYERWHVCECVAMACLGLMGEHAREACLKVRDADMREVKASLGESSR